MLSVYLLALLFCALVLVSTPSPRNFGSAVHFFSGPKTEMSKRYYDNFGSNSDRSSRRARYDDDSNHGHSDRRHGGGGGGGGRGYNDGAGYNDSRGDTYYGSHYGNRGGGGGSRYDDGNRGSGYDQYGDRRGGSGQNYYGGGGTYYDSRRGNYGGGDDDGRGERGPSHQQYRRSDDLSRSYGGGGRSHQHQSRDYPQDHRRRGQDHYRGGGGGRYGGRGGYGGGYGGGRYGGGHDGRERYGRGGGGGGGRGPNLQPGPNTVMTNIIKVKLTPNFHWYQYNIKFEDSAGDKVDDPKVCRRVFREVATEKLGLDLSKACVYFQGSEIFSKSAIPGVTTARDYESNVNGIKLRILDIRCYTTPTEFDDESLLDQDAKNDDGQPVDLRTKDIHSYKIFSDWPSLRAHCDATGNEPVTAPEDAQVGELKNFLHYANIVKNEAMKATFSRWGRDFVDPQPLREQEGIRVYPSYRVELKAVRLKASDTTPSLVLEADMGARVMRTQSLLHAMTNNSPERGVDPSRQQGFKDRYLGQSVIVMADKKAYPVLDILFHETPDSLMIVNPAKGMNMSHTEYFAKIKNTRLQYPRVGGMVAVKGPRGMTCYFPPESVCAEELDDRLRSQLPKVASFKPDKRNESIEKIKAHFVPYPTRSSEIPTILPGHGFYLDDERVKTPATLLAPPQILVAGNVLSNLRVGGNFTGQVMKPNFTSRSPGVTELNVVLFYHRSIGDATQIYNTIKDALNRMSTTFCLADRPMMYAVNGDRDHQDRFIQAFQEGANVPDNPFVIDFHQPAKPDEAYKVVKEEGAKHGYMSQFVNWATCNHSRNAKNSRSILQAVARNILIKCGQMIWWAKIPESIPLPCVTVGVDLFHAPRRFNPETRRMESRSSVAAIVVQVIRSNTDEGLNAVFSRTFSRGEQRHESGLGNSLGQTIEQAMEKLSVNDPKSCVVWRDGVGETQIEEVAEGDEGKKGELEGVREAFRDHGDVKIAFIFAQKRINTKIFTEDSRFGMPAGTLVKGLQDPTYPTFYLQGNSPPMSTPKPVRFIIADSTFEDTDDLISMTWSMCNNYLNWSGPVKVPGPCRLAHKLAEHVGIFDNPENIDHNKFAFKLYYT